MVSPSVGDFMKHFNTNVLDSGVKSLWRPEYAAYMVRNPYYGQSIHFFYRVSPSVSPLQIEGTPGKPYGGLLAHFNVVEANMSNRRLDVAKLLKENEVALCITSFPMLGM